VSDTPRLRPVPDERPRKRGVSWDDIAALKTLLDRDRSERQSERAQPYTVAGLENFAPNTLPQGARGMAQDSALTASYAQMGALYQPRSDLGAMQWLGFPYLAELSTRPEHRRLVEGFAREMTRKWIKVISKGDEDKAERVEAMERALIKFNVQEHFKWAAETDGYFGRSQLYIDVNTADDTEERRLPLRNARLKIPRGSLRKFVRVEPMWCYPAAYNAHDPLTDNFYVPQMWYIQGKEVHTSRLLHFVGRPVPDMLKPAYGFSGLSMTQMVLPYVENWLRTRQSVSDLIHSVSATPVLMTNLMAHLGDAIGEHSELVKRIMLWNVLRDNRDTLVVDKEAEDFKNISAPLGGLDHLQAQSLEQIAAIAGMPLVVYLGITPSGLNASTDGEMVAWFNYVRAFQEFMFGPQLQRVFEIIQMSEFGELDPDITYEFETMREMDEAQVAAIRKQEADTAMVYVDGGIIAPEEERERLARATNSLWSNIDPLDMPEPPPPPEQDGLPGQEPSLESGETPAPPAKSPANQNDGPARDVVTSTRRISHDEVHALARDEFRETDHPRDDDGKFGSGGAGSSGSGGGASQVGAPPRPASAPPKRPSAAPTRSLQAASPAGEKGVRTQADGKPLPKHIAALKIPPGWTDVAFNPDPKGNLLAIGKDAKGRRQPIYNGDFLAAQSAKKFARVEGLAKAMPAIEAKNAKAMQSADPRTRDAADCLDLIMKMGLRPGSETDTGAKVQAYGATTLQGQHVVQTEDGVRLQFTGKKGVALDLAVPDKALGDKLVARAKQAGATGQLFGISESNLLAHMKAVAGSKYKTKDLRTHLGTKTGAEAVASMPMPKSAKEYKDAVMKVGKIVSAKLGNTPVIAIQSYVSPSIFANWRSVTGGGQIAGQTA
jgi:phage-related protein (TIGR01555 family)